MKIHSVSNIFKGTPMKRRFYTAISILVMIGLTAMPAMAFDWSFTGHIGYIQTSFMPSGFDFYTDNTPSTCPGGFLFYWGQGSDTPTQQANAKAVFASLLAAQLSGHSVLFYGINPNSNSQYCIVQAVWVNNQ